MFTAAVVRTTIPSLLRETLIAQMQMVPYSCTIGAVLLALHYWRTSWHSSFGAVITTWLQQLHHLQNSAVRCS